MGVFADNPRGASLAAYNAVMIAVPTIFIALRFWSRFLADSPKHGSFWWDDWVALAALPFSIASNALAIRLAQLGVGRRIAEVPPEDVLSALEVLFASYITYDTGLTLAKFSALLFYLRIFEKRSKKFVWALWATVALVWAWWFGIIFGSIFMCNPVAKNWNPSLPGHCGSTGALWLGSAIPSVIIDVFILLLPMPMLWKLHLAPGRKVLLVGLFVCGYGVVVISLGRLVTVTTDEDELNADLTYAGVDSLYWLGSEIPVTIMSICLPSLFFLYRRAKKFGPGSLFTARSGETHLALGHFSRTGGSDRKASTKWSARSTASTESNQHLHEPFDNETTSGPSHTTTVGAGFPMQPMPATKDGIHVSSDIHVMSRAV